MWYDQNWDVGAYDATCLGFGKRIRNDAVSSGRNKWLYRHFDCIVELDDGTSDEDTLHVTGRRGFKLYE